MLKCGQAQEKSFYLEMKTSLSSCSPTEYPALHAKNHPGDARLPTPLPCGSANHPHVLGTRMKLLACFQSGWGYKERQELWQQPW